MQNSDSLAQAIVEEVRISAHDPRWAAQFVAERDRLLDILPGRFAAIEHIGSTAVPRLSAKPIIDILAGVSALSDADTLLEPLCRHGYETSVAFNATLPDRRWLMRHALGRRTHHLHLVVFGGEQWTRHLRFRDVLRADTSLVARYVHLKQELAEQHRYDREAYTFAKTAFIDEVLKNAEKPSLASGCAPILTVFERFADGVPGGLGSGVAPGRDVREPGHPGCEGR